MKTISYLHFSDLHIGLESQKTLMPKLKKDLHDDIKRLHKKTGNWDVVFFTGDLVQKGITQEFEMATEFLHELWAVFNSLGCAPIFIGVPGNHDLERGSDPFNATLKILLDWKNQTEIQEQCFWIKENDYLDYIKERFANYSDWYSKLSLPKPSNVKMGYLPGDYSCQIEIKGINLGCICLNSTFLQLNPSDFKGHLEINRQQISHIFKDDYQKWLSSNHISLLLTHHAPDWFSTKGLESYNEDIYYPEAFHSHLCGHLHDPNAQYKGVLGSIAKCTQIAPSLFGLEKLGDNIDRIHGYFAGRFEITDSSIVQKLWPRIMMKQKDESRKIVPDYSFNLDDDSLACQMVLRTLDSSLEDKEVSVTKGENLSKIESPSLITTKDNIFEDSITENDNLTRTYYPILPSHTKIREVERCQVSENLIHQRFAWVVTKWGLGEDGFIGSLLARAEINDTNCFSISCDDVRDIKQVIKLFENTFQTSFNNFIDIVSKLEKPLIVFNRVNPALFETKSSANEFLRFIKSILDFAAKLKIVVITEQKTGESTYTELISLDAPAVRLYASVYNLKELELDNYIAIEKLHRISSGLPVYLDSFLEQLKVCSLSDLVEDGFTEEEIQTTVKLGTTPMFSTIRSLQNSTEDSDKRSFELLKILSLLYNGEIFERIKHFYSNMTFHPIHISKLEKLALLDVIPINSVILTNDLNIKILKHLKVPRYIRDYVASLISEEDKILIYKSACDLYLGNRWREGKIKNMKSSISDLSLIIYSNSHLAIRSLLYNAIKEGNFIEIERYANIAIGFCDNLSDHSAYKDSAAYAEEFYNLIQETSCTRQKVYIAKIYGENLKMNDELELKLKAIDILRQDVLGNGATFLSKSDKAHINIEIAYSYVTRKDKSLATFHANEAKKYSEKDSSSHVSGEYIIASFIDDAEEKLKKMKSLFNKAKREGYSGLCHNITLSMFKFGRSNDIKQIDSIIVSPDASEYNRIRAIINKCEFYVEENKINDLSDSDIVILNKAYSYLFHQSLLNLFDRCHNIIWKYWIYCKDYAMLLNLFRYSSFVWRVAGNEEKEKLYLNLLISDEDFDLNKCNGEYFNHEANINYFLQRKDAITDN